MAKKIVSANIDESIPARYAEAGVKNLSRRFEELAKADLAALEGSEEPKEDKWLSQKTERLKVLETEWDDVQRRQRAKEGS